MPALSAKESPVQTRIAGLWHGHPRWMKLVTPS